MSSRGKLKTWGAAWLAVGALLLAGCATRSVRCDGKLEPINPAVQKPEPGRTR